MCIYNSKNPNQKQIDTAYRQQQSGMKLLDIGGGIGNRDVAEISYGETTAGKAANTPATGAEGLTPGATTQRQPSLLGSSPGQANTAAPSNRRRGLGRAGVSTPSGDALGQNTLLGG